MRSINYNYTLDGEALLLTEEAIGQEQPNMGETDSEDYLVNFEDETLLSSEKNKKATALNQSQVQKSRLDLNDIIAALTKTVNVNDLRKSMAAGALSGSQQVDAVFTEMVHQFQVAHFLNPADQDGIIGRSTLETLGFYEHGLKPALSSAGFYGQAQLNRRDVKDEIPKQTGQKYTAANWFQWILRPAWLGVKISDGVHLLLLEKLKEAEAWLSAQSKYKGLSPADLGRALGFNASTRYSAARLSSSNQAMHGLGLAIDINVDGNPWVGAGWVTKGDKLLQERTRMIEALRKASGNNALPGSTIFAYLHSIAQADGNDTAKSFNTLKQRNNEFISYLRNNSTELNYWKASATFDYRNPLNGFLNLHPDLVYALRQVAGLAWGAIDFGPYASGDIMHFDWRTIGFGKFICEKIGGFVPKSGHPAIDGKLDKEFSAESNFHEAFVENPAQEFHEEGVQGEAEEVFSNEEEAINFEDKLFESLVPVVSSNDLRQRMDDYFNQANSTYTLPDGTSISVYSQFRLTDGDPISTEQAVEKTKKLLVAKKGTKFYLGLANQIVYAAYGRAKPKDIAKITQALIDAGEFDQFKAKYSSLNNGQIVRRIQFEYGIGIDCGGYVQLSFINAFSGNDDDPASKRTSFGLTPTRLGENLYGLSAYHFDKIDFLNARTADLMVMKPRKNSDGSIHAVIVVDHSIDGDIHTFLVDSSWGHMYGDDASGIARRKFKYDSGKKEWWDIDPRNGEEAGRNEIGPYQAHPIKGVYRAKPKPVKTPKKVKELFEYALETEEYDKDWSTAIKQNQYYANKLGWLSYYDQIGKLLQPFLESKNTSPDEAAFAQALAGWQKQQGFSDSESDGILGPHTWARMQPLLTAPVQAPPAPYVSGGTAPSIETIFAFNQWHAQKILSAMNAGVVGANAHLTYNPRTQLEKIAAGQEVIHVDPNAKLIQALPIISHICDQASANQYYDIIIGSFIRDPDSDGSCYGHCEGRCIDINYKGGSFESSGAVQMVINIFNYLYIVSTPFKKNFGFGLPLQGDFFGHKNLNKYHSLPVSNLNNEQLRQLIPALGYVFPDNDNHLHIQVRWVG